MKTKDYLLLVLIFLLPYTRGMFFMHTTFIAGALGVVILLCYVKQNKKIVIPYETSSLLLYTIILMYGISITYAVDKGMAFLGYSKSLVIIVYYFIFVQLGQEQKYRIKTVIMWSGIIMSCVSLISIFIPSLMSFTFQNNRLGGFFQYANSFGLYMLIILLFILENNKKPIYFIPIIIACIYLTYSRSLYLISAIVIIMIFFITKKSKVKLIFLIPPGILLGYICSSLGQVSESLERIKHISLQVSEWQTRLLYYIDGLNIIKDNPFGIGYLGFYYIQRMYQSGVYFVKFVHSSIVQLGIDIGLIGILCFIGLICTSVLKKNIDIKYRAILILIYGHSMIDFDLQFTFFWILIVLILSMTTNKYKIVTLNRAYRTIGAGMVLILLYLYLFIVTGAFYLKEYKFAYDLYPYYTQAGVRLVKQYKKVDKEKAAIIAEDVLQHNEKVYYLNNFLCDYYREKEDYITSYYYAKNAMELYPLSLADLEKYIETLLILVKSDIIENELKNDMLIEVLSIEDYVNEIVDRLDTRAFQIKHVPNFAMSEELFKLREEASELYWGMYREGDVR